MVLRSVLRAGEGGSEEADEHRVLIHPGEAPVA
jgi:hypothetical protein